MGQNLQILSPQIFFPPLHSHLRTRKPHQRCRAEFYDCDCRACDSWTRGIGYSAGRVYDYCVCGGEGKKGDVYGGRGDGLWGCGCCWAFDWGIADGWGELEVVSFCFWNTSSLPLRPDLTEYLVGVSISTSRSAVSLSSSFLSLSKPRRPQNASMHR